MASDLLKLYGQAIEYLSRAEQCAEQRGVCIARAQQIIHHLHDLACSLAEENDISKFLAQLYSYIAARLVEAIDGDGQALQTARDMLIEMRRAWRQAQTKQAKVEAQK